MLHAPCAALAEQAVTDGQNQDLVVAIGEQHVALEQRRTLELTQFVTHVRVLGSLDSLFAGQERLKVAFADEPAAPCLD